MQRVGAGARVPEERDVADFRRWLVGKLAMSRWPVRKGDTDETMGLRLGVQPDVLAEARSVMQRVVAKKGDGRTRRLGMPRAGDGKLARYHVFLEPPAEIYKEWCAYRDRRRLTNAVLLRSAVSHVLTLPAQPASLHSGRSAWVFRGQACAQENIREHKFRFKTNVSEATFRALGERAANTGTSPSAIARWAVTALLEGKLERQRPLWIVTSLDSLYREAYITRPKLVKE